MKGKIRHSGKIVSVNSGTLTVEIIRTEACASCHAASMCSMSSQTVRTISVDVYDAENWTVGEEVNVSLVARMGMKAVRICYIYPLFVLLAAMGLLKWLTGSDLLCGLGAIAAVAVYYLAVYSVRDRFRKEYVFMVEKK